VFVVRGSSVLALPGWQHGWVGVTIVWLLQVGAQEATYKQKHAYPYHPGPASDEVVDGTVDATAVEGEESKTPEEVSNLPFFNVVAVLHDVTMWCDRVVFVLWKHVVQRHVGGDFVCVASLAIWGIGLAVFVRSHLVSEVRGLGVVRYSFASQHLRFGFDAGDRHRGEE
jgi:hypothetical protein